MEKLAAAIETLLPAVSWLFSSSMTRVCRLSINLGCFMAYVPSCCLQTAPSLALSIVYRFMILLYHYIKSGSSSLPALRIAALVKPFGQSKQVQAPRWWVYIHHPCALPTTVYKICVRIAQRLGYNTSPKDADHNFVSDLILNLPDSYPPKQSVVNAFYITM